MNARLLPILIFASLLLATACSPGVIEKLGAPAQNQGGTESSGQVELLGQAEPGGQVSSPGGEVISNSPPPSWDGGGVITSSGGQTSSGSSVSNEPGMSGSSAAGGAAASGEAQLPVNWLTYQDKSYGFSISYPDTYVILDEIELLKDIDPVLVHRVRFQDKKLASGDTAKFELPQFTIEVYEKPAIDTLQAYIGAKIPGWTVESFKLGDLQGYRVSSNRLVAPNEFYFFEGSKFIYKLTPMGPYSQEMLQSFKIEG